MSVYTVIFFAGLLTARTAQAQLVTSTSPVVLLSEALLLPIVHYLFLISGAMAIRNQLRGKRSSQWKWEIPLVCVLVLISSGGPPLAIMVSTGLALLGTKRGVDLFRISTSQLARRKGCSLGIKISSIAAVCVSLLLGGSAYALFSQWIDSELFVYELRVFAARQQEYATAVGSGKYVQLPPDFRDQEQWFRDEPTAAVARAACGIYAFAEGPNPFFDLSITYDEDGTGFEVFAVERRFVLWPYRLVSPSKAYYMNETGIVYHRNLYFPPGGSGAQSSIEETVLEPDSSEP